YDWVHRTGANPPNEPVPGDFCENKSARPFLYEGTFAHEYQHLLEHYEDANEVNWVNEGLSDWAQTLTGYVDPSVPITDIGTDSHVQCFLGYLGVETPANPVPREGGPENSLTAWGDQGDDEILCDYGAAYTLMEFLRDSYGRPLMTRLHRLNANGFRGLTRAIALSGGTDTARETLHKWIAAVALDGVLDDGATMHGGDPAWYQVSTLDATINWDTPRTHSDPGAPPNGADFVRLRGANGDFLTAADLRTLEFDGAEALDPLPVEWVLDVNPPDHTADPALYSGEPAPNINRAIVEEVAVPTADPTLTFANRYSMEEGYDYAYVEVSTDGGATWTRQSNNHTVVEGGFNGESGCPLGSQGGDACSAQWVNESFDLGAYAGQTVHVAFRAVYDGGVEFPGWWIDDVAVGGTAVSDGTDILEWQTPTQVNPVEVEGFTVQLVSYDDAHQNVYLGQVPLGEGFTASLDEATLQSLLGTDGNVVGAIIMYDESTEEVVQYAPYELTVNNIVQPGGAATTP
ncbi:MAG: choice-of-anchor J domain-containing protein, partial [Actinomycetota bacterium]